MTELQERDAMICRSCGNEERASEGYPCHDCGTFICLICNFRGVVLCRACTEKAAAGGAVAEVPAVAPAVPPPAPPEAAGAASAPDGAADSAPAASADTTPDVAPDSSSSGGGE